MEIEENFQKISLVEHVLHRPDSYVGSITSTVKSHWIFDENKEKIVQKEIKYVPALYKIFDEILVNAADNKRRDNSMSFIKIDVNQANNEISICNDGCGVPVILHNAEGVYIPTLIFGNLLTSSNYNDSEEKFTGGRNGFGAKLCNLFSTEFTVETSSQISGYKFKQIWSNNMTQFSEPFIEKATTPDFTKITFKPDLARFKIDCLDSDILSLFYRRACDISSNLNDVSVVFNGIEIPIKSFRDYVELHENNNTKFAHKTINNSMEVAVTLSLDDSFTSISFVNGILTSGGGMHVNHFIKKLLPLIINKLEKQIKDNAEFLRPNYVKNCLWVFLKADISNPCFESQSKEFLTSVPNGFASTIQISDKFVDDIITCGLLEKVVSLINAKKSISFIKSVKDKSKLLNIPKLDDAHYAGTKMSQECTLILTEGDSAKSLALSGLEVLDKKFFGIFPLCGKLINIRKSSERKMLINKECKSLLAILNLKYGDNYLTKDSFKKLRYGKVMMMTDQDTHGSHIKGLIMNFFHYNWPELMKHDFLQQFVTPLMKAFKGNSVLHFYCQHEFLNWKSNTNDFHKWNVKYYKGLGTSTSIEMKEYFRNIDQHRKSFYYSGPQDDEMIKLAFEEDQCDERRTWISNYRNQFENNRTNKEITDNLYDKEIDTISYSDFVNKELIIHGNYDNESNIPSLMDGLKPSQRKILYTCFQRYKNKEVKVTQLSGSVAELTNYFHGENSLSQAIILLAQDYVGSNNLNFLMPIGQFGTRVYGGTDNASPRYIYTKLSPVAQYLFLSKDENLLEYMLDDNDKPIEPRWYAPIIPTILVNGCLGIGTGWSSFIPNYNPLDIIKNVRLMIDGKNPVSMTPWYRNFKGTIQEIRPNVYITSGIYRICHSKQLEITELPIGTTTQMYKEFLFKILMPSSQEIIENIEDFSTDTNVKFVISLTKDIPHKLNRNLITSLGLKKEISTKRMILFTEKDDIKKYDSVEEILIDFYKVRLSIYEKVKEFYIRKVSAEVVRYKNQFRFLNEVINGTLNLQNMVETEIIKLLEKNLFESDPLEKFEKLLDKKTVDAYDKFDYKYLLNMPIKSFTKDKLTSLKTAYESKLKELNYLEEKLPKDLWLDDLNKLEREIMRLYGDLK